MQIDKDEELQISYIDQYATLKSAVNILVERMDSIVAAKCLDQKISL